MKRRIKLTESDLYKIIKECVNTILYEDYEDGTYVVVDENMFGYVAEKRNNNSLYVNILAVDPSAHVHGYAKYGGDPYFLNKQIIVYDGHYRKATSEDGKRFKVIFQ